MKARNAASTGRLSVPPVRGPRILLFLALAGVLSIAPGVFAQDAGTEAGEASAAPLFDGGISGWVAGSAFVRPDADTVFASAGVRGALILDGYAFDLLGVKLALEGYSNLAGAGDSIDLETSLPYPLAFEAVGNDRFLGFLDLKEAWAELPLGDFDLRVGKQILAWGLADGNNPTDTLNPRHIGTRLVSTLDEQKMGTLAANLVYNLPSNLGTVQALFLPVSVPNDMPSIARDLTTPSTPVLRVIIKEDEAPEIAAENMEGGVRALFYLGSVQASASWFTYLDRYPDFDVTSATSFVPSMTIINTFTPVHNRIQQFGLDATWLVGGYDLRAETAFSLTGDVEGSDPAAKNPSLTGVVQGSRSFLDGMLTASLAWAPRWVMNHKDPSDYSDTIDQKVAEQVREYDGQGYALENAFSVRLAGKLLAETLQPEALFLAELAARDWLGTVSVGYNLADGLNLKAGAAFYGSFLEEGDADRELGTFSNARTVDNDYLFIELRFSF